MKKKIFRERYNQDTKITEEKAIKMIDEAVEKLNENITYEERKEEC